MANNIDTPPSVSPTPATTKVEDLEKDLHSDSDNDPSSDEPVERELQDRLADQKKLDSRFTPKQLEYLNENKDVYRYAAGKQRREIAQATGERFLKQVQSAGRDPSKKEIAALYNNVKLWYAQRARSRHGPMHWTINWTGRQVFYKENTALIQETQRKLYELSTGKKATEELEGGIDLDLVDEQEALGSSNDSIKAPKLFHFFQRAITAEWNALTKKEQEEYEAKALVWREKGPNREERARLAEKEAGRVLHQFADDVYRQMGVRIYYLVSYEDTSGDHIAFSLDFNNQIDNGVSFKQAERGYLERVDLENHWAGFVRRTLPEVKNEDEEAHHVPKKRGDPLPIQCNASGAPIIPDISTLPKSVKPHRHLPNLVRSIMRHDYACARNLPPNDLNSAPPWKEMVKDWRKFIAEEFWPSEWPVGDPGNLGVDSCRTILRYWFQRQKNGDIPFQFHSYWTGGNGWEPRQLPAKVEDSDFEDQPAPKQKKRRGVPKKETKKAAKGTKKLRGDAATSTTQSASAAVTHGPSPEVPHVVAVDDSRPPADSPPDISDALPTPVETATATSLRRKGKSRAPTHRVDSSPEVESERETPMDSDGEGAKPGRLRKRETPMTQRLIGATAKLTLSTPSREGSTTPSKDPAVAPKHQPKKETRFAPSLESYMEGSPRLKRIQDKSKGREDDESKGHEDDERKGRERIRQEALQAAKERMEGKRSNAKTASASNTAALESGSVKGSQGSEGGTSLGASPATIPDPVVAEAVAVAKEHQADRDRQGECEMEVEQLEGDKQKGKEVEQGQSSNPGPEKALQALGEQGVDVGPSTPRKQPKEDRLLLAAAASYLPTSAKRDRKPKRLFEQDVPNRKRR